MKREPSSVARSFRVVSLVLTVVGIVAFTTVGYSANADLNSVVGALGSGTSSRGFATSVSVNGTSETLHVNATIPNAGLYPLSVGISCLPSTGSVKVTCSNSSVSVQPGQKQVLRFTMVLENLSAITAGGISVRGNISLALQPFASMSLVVPFSFSPEQQG